MRFSKPLSSCFEYGSSSGSAQTTRSRAIAGPPSASVHATRARSALRQREDIEHASLRRTLLQIGHHVRESERGTAVARVEVAGNHRTGPSAHTGEHRDVLLAVGSAIGHRLPDDSRSGLELPQQRAALRVDRLEPAVHRAVEHDVAAGSHAVNTPRCPPGPGFIFTIAPTYGVPTM